MGNWNDSRVLEQQVNRMIQDPKTSAKLHDFFMDWLKVDHFENISKDHQKFPGFDEKIDGGFERRPWGFRFRRPFIPRKQIFETCLFPQICI